MLKIVQNRNKLIDLSIGQISDMIVHQILNKAARSKETSERYIKEIKISLNRAESYREKINPINKPLSDKDIKYIKNKIINKVRNELNLRIEKGYKNINLDVIEDIINNNLKDIKIRE